MNKINITMNKLNKRAMDPYPETAFYSHWPAGYCPAVSFPVSLQDRVEYYR